MKVFSISFIFILFFSVTFGLTNYVYVNFDESSQKYMLSKNVVANNIAFGNYSDDIHTTGWAFLHVSTVASQDDVRQAYAAGLAEGYLTKNLIFKHWMNTVHGYCKDKGQQLCYKVQTFVEENLEWMKSQIQSLGSSDPYWHQVKLILAQLDGLQDGYYAEMTDHGHVVNKPSSNSVLPVYDILFKNKMLMFQVAGDLEDLEQVLNGSQINSEHVFGSGHCSALIKILPKNSDIYFAHDSWTSYQNMLRIIKKYEFKFHLLPSKDSELIPGHTFSMSSYPGTLFSIDDFYLVSSGLAVTETTTGNNNPALWPKVKARGQVFTWLRTLTATRLAKTGLDWTDIFRKFNSGTYNNQWMVLDYKVFEPGKALPKKDLLHILEQLPGMIIARDMTSLLLKQSYWPSYNAPYFKEIFNASGLPAMVKKYGDWFSYDRTPRALIFKRDHKKVVDMPSMMKLMRYNDFKHDPLSRCNCTPPYSGENAISARCDLNPADGTYPIAALGHRSHGGVDMKVTTHRLFQKYEMVAIGGPTFDPLPPFQWSKSDFRRTTPHLGHPDLWKFDPVHVQWNTPRAFAKCENCL